MASPGTVNGVLTAVAESCRCEGGARRATRLDGRVGRSRSERGAVQRHHAAAAQHTGSTPVSTTEGEQVTVQCANCPGIPRPTTH